MVVVLQWCQFVFGLICWMDVLGFTDAGLIVCSVLLFGFKLTIYIVGFGYGELLI